MNRFLLFSGLFRYPQGGAGDFYSSHESLSAAMDRGDRLIVEDSEWAEIMDTVTGDIHGKYNPHSTVWSLSKVEETE